MCFVAVVVVVMVGGGGRRRYYCECMFVLLLLLFLFVCVCIESRCVCVYIACVHRIFIYDLTVSNLYQLNNLTSSWNSVIYEIFPCSTIQLNKILYSLNS